MSLTLTQLSQAIQDYTQNIEQDFNANIPVFIRQAENRIGKAVLLPNFKNNQVGAMVAGNRFLTMPAGFLAPLSLTIVNGSSYVPLLPKEVAFIYELYPVITALATPKYYAFFNDASLLLGPTPDANYPVELEYYYQPPSITVSGTSWLGDNAEACLLYACLVEAYTFMKGEDDMMKLYDMKYKEALVDLKKIADMDDAMDDFTADPIQVKSGQ